jgi:hypothetical protein
VETLIASDLGAGRLDRFGETSTDGPEHKGGHITFGFDGKIGGFAGEFVAAVELQTGFPEEFSGEAQVFGSIDTPEPEFFFIALEEVEGLLEFFHGAIKRGGEEEDWEVPGMPWILRADADAIFAGLILFDGAAVVISNAG